jgi:hypothetical protein
MSLLVKIDRYCRRTGLPPSKFGRLAVHDPRLVHDLRMGRQLGPAITSKILAFMAETQA